MRLSTLENGTQGVGATRHLVTGLGLECEFLRAPGR